MILAATLMVFVVTIMIRVDILLVGGSSPLIPGVYLMASIDFSVTPKLLLVMLAPSSMLTERTKPSNHSSESKMEFYTPLYPGTILLSVRGHRGPKGGQLTRHRNQSGLISGHQTGGGKHCSSWRSQEPAQW